MTNKTTIFYFTATGNSLKAAMDIAEVIGNVELVAIKPNMQISHPDSNKVGFIFPVYMGILPKLVNEFMENFPAKSSGVYYFAVTTYYLYRGIALSVMDKLLRNKGAKLSYSNSISTVGTCLMEYEVSAKKREPILKKADDKTIVIANELKNDTSRKSTKYYTLSTNLHGKAFKMLFGKMKQKFSLEQNCIGCGMCAKVCPVNNISLVNGKPDWQNNCEACHACAHWCPQNAINIGKSKERLQYHNSKISFKQMLTMRDA